MKGLYLGMIKTESSSLPEYEDEEAIITSPIDLLAPALEDGSLVPSGNQWCQLVYTLIGDVDDVTDNDNTSREKCGAAYVKEGIEYQPTCITGKCEHVVVVVVVHGISDEEEKEEEEKKSVKEVPLLSKFMFMQ